MFKPQAYAKKLRKLRQVTQKITLKPLYLKESYANYAFYPCAHMSEQTIFNFIQTLAHGFYNRNLRNLRNLSNKSIT